MDIKLGIAAVVVVAAGAYLFTRDGTVKHPPGPVSATKPVPHKVATPAPAQPVTFATQAAPSFKAVTPPAGPSADLLHVTSISLGKPRLALINGRQVSEGESFTVPGADHKSEFTFLVQRITDGEVELSDGTQSITAALSLPQRKPLR